MAEPQVTTEQKPKGGPEPGRTDGPRLQPERASWSEPGVRRQAQEAEEAAGLLFRDWSSALTALYSRNMTLASRRGRAMADYWDELARARQPTDLLNAGANYWSRMVSDWSSFTAGEVHRSPGAQVEH